MQRAVQPLREGDLLAVREGLIAEHQHGVLVHAGPDLGERLRVVDPPEVDWAHLGGEVRMELLERERHRVPPGADADERYWITECGVATIRVTLICSRSIMVGTRGEISFFQ